MREKIIQFLLRFHYKKITVLYKVVSLLTGGLFFLLILPVCFMLIGNWVEQYVSIPCPVLIKNVISIITLLPGVFFLLWASYIQLTIGKGTPAPMAPTRKLIITGPYKLMRNPIEFGAILYYFGLGSLLYTISVGLTSGLQVLILGSAYHKFIEEKELEQRFGAEYQEYKEQVPFLFPKILK